MTHALTIDLEDWYHVCGAEAHLPPERWDDLDSNLPATTLELLDLLDRHGARATFFTLGYVAERFPHVVAEVVRRGHRVGSHGQLHRRVYDQRPEEFRRDVAASLDAVEAACGVRPISYRAPEWSLRPECRWGFEILADLGIRFDSSVVPLTWMGSIRTPHEPHEVRTGAGAITEVPLSTERIFHERLPYSGGLANRFFPEFYVARILRREARAGRPAVVYMHPSDLEPELPRIPLPVTRRFMQRFRHGCVEPRFRRLLETFRFVPLEEAFGDGGPNGNGAAAPIRPSRETRAALRRSAIVGVAGWFGLGTALAVGLGIAAGPWALLVPAGAVGGGYLYHARWSRRVRLRTGRRTAPDLPAGAVETVG